MSQGSGPGVYPSCWSVYGSGWVSRVGITGGYTGGYTGYYPATQPPRAKPDEEPHDSEAGPGSPNGAGVGGHGVGVSGAHFACPRTGNPRALLPTHLPVPGRPAPCGRWSAGPPRSKRARFDVISLKLSQNREVSPKYAEKASHSPYFQKRGQKSPLEILRFPFSPAFSCKELMGRFDPRTGVYCQNDEVSPGVHPSEVQNSVKRVLNSVKRV